MVGWEGTFTSSSPVKNKTVNLVETLFIFSQTPVKVEMYQSSEHSFHSVQAFSFFFTAGSFRNQLIAQSSPQESIAQARCLRWMSLSLLRLRMKSFWKKQGWLMFYSCTLKLSQRQQIFLSLSLSPLQQSLRSCQEKKPLQQSYSISALMRGRSSMHSFQSTQALFRMRPLRLIRVQTYIQFLERSSSASSVIMIPPQLQPDKQSGFSFSQL